MSRSNPVDNRPNPAKLRFEWDGANGKVRYFDREAKQNANVKDGFTFILLDELATVRGWHEPSESPIYSNEVRDTRQEVLVVKAFKGPQLAEGFYSNIKDRIVACGGHFTANCYIAFRNDEGGLDIGMIQFKGAALGAWMEFKKENRKEIYEQAVQIKGFEEGKKGKVVFRVPVFHLAAISPESQDRALELDKELQDYLKAYFARTKSAVPPTGEESQPDAEPEPQPDPEPEPDPEPPTEEDDVPF